MTKQKFVSGFLAMAFLLLIGSVVIYCIAPGGGPKITAGTCARIRGGMSEKEVENLLGCPPGDYRSRSRSYNYVGGGIMAGNDYDKYWYGDQGMIMIGFSGNTGKSKHKFFCPASPSTWPKWLDDYFPALTLLLDKYMYGR